MSKPLRQIVPGRKEASAHFHSVLGHHPPKHWPVGKITGTVRKLQGYYGKDAAVVYAASVKGASHRTRKNAELAHIRSVVDFLPIEKRQAAVDQHMAEWSAKNKPKKRRKNK